MPKRRRIRNVTESTSNAGEDRADARDPQAPTGSAAEASSTSETTSPESDKDAGRSAAEEEFLTEEELNEMTTRAAAIVAKVVEKDFDPRPAPRTFAQCPRCGERRFSPDLVGKTVTCPNCRTGQKLV